jgi:hypothetical protein
VPSEADSSSPAAPTEPDAIMDAMTAWTRPYRDPFRIATGVLALFGSGIACVIAVGILAGHWTEPWARVPAALFVALWLTCAWRLQRTALVISDHGVRVRWLLRTRTMDWNEIDGFRFGLDVMVVNRLWIDLTDGRRIRTPVQRGPRLRYVSGLNDGGTKLSYDAAERLLHRLDQELGTRRARS